MFFTLFCTGLGLVFYRVVTGWFESYSAVWVLEVSPFPYWRFLISGPFPALFLSQSHSQEWWLGRSL